MGLPQHFVLGLDVDYRILLRAPRNPRLMATSHVLELAEVACISSIPRNDMCNYLDLYIRGDLKHADLKPRWSKA